ncbi:MAG: sigma factor-like helix-turn-helix DNA-binding protein, partial [Bacteroidota bacterium]
DELRKLNIGRWFCLQGLLEGSDRELQARMVVEPHDREIQDIVTAGLRRLPEKYRLPVVLKDIDGLSYEEMAGVLGCELGTVKSRLFRGRAMLKKILAPLLEEGP